MKSTYFRNISAHAQGRNKYTHLFSIQFIRINLLKCGLLECLRVYFGQNSNKQQTKWNGELARQHDNLAKTNYNSLRCLTERGLNIFMWFPPQSICLTEFTIFRSDIYHTQKPTSFSSFSLAALHWKQLS